MISEQQLQCAIATAIIALTDTGNMLYKQVVPLWLIQKTCEYFDSIVAALYGLRLIKTNLDSGAFDTDTAFDLFKKQMQIVNDFD